MTQFLRDQASDREEVVTPLMLDGTYLSRNFATLGPMIRQPPCDYLFISFQRLSLLKIGPAKVPHRSYHLSPAFGKETLWKTTEKQLFYRCPKNFFLKEDTCEGRKLRLSRSLSRFEFQCLSNGTEVMECWNETSGLKKTWTIGKKLPLEPKD